MYDAANHMAYIHKYVDVDSSLSYANRAYSLCKDYPDGLAEAMNHRAFVLYQEMRFSDAANELDRVYSVTHNQVELLCADVMRMKLSQRTGELRTLYRAWHSAERRLARIDEELSLLSAHHQERVMYARTEMHLVAATYYYYTHQDSLLRAEMNSVEPYMLIPTDTAQWCSYMYMLGTGRVLTGDSISTSLAVFDNLVNVLTIALRSKARYFQANSLQSLALIMDNPDKRQCIKEHRGGGMDFIIAQYADARNLYLGDSLSLILVGHALDIFKEYGDCFQIANVLRTKAELLFRQERYAEALLPLTEAMEIIGRQHRIETKRLPYWEAAIYERLSLTYSALGQHERAMEYRTRYLDMMRVMRQDLEENARAEELRFYSNKLYISLSVILLLILSVGIIFWILLKKVKKHGIRQVRESEESLQTLRDETCAREMELSREKLANVERRAKVSLAENVLPYINRMLNTSDMEYIAELADGIMRINDVLTEWIMVRQGKLAMNISSFSLQPILDTIAKNRATFSRKGIDFEVPVDVTYRVKADRALTLFMINTLCDNARKFTPEGGRVWIGVDATEEYVEISVSDNGQGISPHNVDKINNSKVFRIHSYSSEDKKGGEGKGFGFGLMNCKGIIAQMKKMSDRFRCCAFGVESAEGSGSRFWFRLPRILSMLLILFSTSFAVAQGNYEEAEEYYRLLRDGNVARRHAEAMKYGHRALEVVPVDSISLRMHIENEMAIAAQALFRWEDYKYHNRQCFLLYRRLTADPNLPVYARRLHLVKSEVSWSLFFIPIFFFLSIFFVVLVVRRSKRLRCERQKQTDALQMQYEHLGRVQYELDRLHIQNRILDNCLSTIKHETMYYPARIRQMALAEETDREALGQLVSYYSEIYTILLEQAQRQTANRVAMDESILVELRRRIMASVPGVDVHVSVRDKGDIQEVRVSAIDGDIPDNLFTPEAGNLNAFVAREILRMHDSACGYPGLRLYVENNEIIITLWKNSRLLSSRTFSWN